MAQIKERKRLLLNGDIAGYEWYYIMEGAEHVTKWYQREGESSWFNYYNNHDIDFDSFEQGIEIGDKYWFEGDVIELKYPLQKEVLQGTLLYTYGTMMIVFETVHEPITLISVKGWVERPDDNGYLKRIGDIHKDKQTNE